MWQNPKRNEVLRVRKEDDQVALLIDPHSVAFTRKSIVRVVPDIVGHIPLEISRYVWFFMDRGGRVSGRVDSPRYRPSPTPKGGLEIILIVTFTIEEDKKRYVGRLKELISNNCETHQENEEVDAGAGNSEIVEIDDDSGGDDDDLDIMFMSDGENVDEDDAEQDM